jgi:hypothetical protein
MEERCLECGTVLFRRELLDAQGHSGMAPETPMVLEFDGLDDFYQCPQCAVKNVVIALKSPAGLEQLTIVHTKA